MSVDYKNLRVHPFTGQKNPKQFTDVGQGNVGGTYFTVEHHDDMNADGFFLPEGIYYNPSDPTNLVIKDFLSGVPMAEVARTTNPSGNEYRADYDAPDPYRNTGFVECNASDLGKHLKVTYKGTGLLNNTQNYVNQLINGNINGDLSIGGTSLSSVISKARKSLSRQAIMNMKRVTTLGAHPPFGAWSVAGDGNGVLVAVQTDATRIIKRSTDNGATWADIGAHPWTSGNQPRQILYANGKFIIAGDSALLGYSTNGGVSWTSVSPSVNASSTLSRISYANGLYLIAGLVCKDGSSHPCMISSSDGITWTTHVISSSVTADCSDILFRGGTYFATVSDGYVYTSTDLTTWTRGIQWYTSTGLLAYMAQSATTMIIMGSTFNYTGGIFVLKYSKNNGASWSDSETYGVVKDDSGTDLATGQNLILAVSYEQNSDLFILSSKITGSNYCLFISPDGITWTRAAKMLDDVGSGTVISNPILYSQGKFFAPSTTFLLVGDGEVW